MKISLIIPTLNERGSIEALLRAVEAAVKTQNDEFEIIIIDDGSTDGTVEHAQSLTFSIPLRTVVRSERGLATAVLRGFSEAQGDVLGVMDADLSHPPEKIPELIEALRGADLVLWSRNISGGMVEEWPWYRKWASGFATLLVRPLGVRVSDPMSGFFFLRRSILEDVECSPIGYKILLEIVVKAQPSRIQEVPYVFRNRNVGKSKMGMQETVNYLRHLWRLFGGNCLKPAK